MTIIGDEEENLTEDAMTGEAAERLFSEEAMVAATLRACAIESTLGLYGYKAPGKGSAPLDQIALLLGEDLIDEPGGLLNSAESTLRSDGPSDIYFLGLNPGGEVERDYSILDGSPTIYESLALTRLGVSGWDQNWSRERASFEPGQAPIQLRFKHIARFLKIAYGDIFATNLIFARSRRFKALAGVKDRIEACLPIHKAMIDIVRPKRLWVMGNPANAGDAMKFHADVQWRSAKYKDWSIGHGTVDFCGHTMTFCHTPHLTFWDAEAEDKQELLAFAFGVHGQTE